MKRWLMLLAASLSLAVPVMANAAGTVDLEPFIADGSFRDIKISPTGEYFALTAPRDGQTGIMVLRRSDMTIASTMRFPRDTHVAEFWWVSDERLLMSMSETWGTRDDPVPTGEIYGMDADGGRKELLVGWRAQGTQTGSRIGVRSKDDMVRAFLVDSLQDEDDHVLVSVRPFAKDPFTSIEKMDVHNGRRVRVASSPVKNAHFVTDGQGRVRFTVGSLADNLSQLFYRADDAAPWQEINHEGASGRVETPLGFSRDDNIAYLSVSQPKGPDRIVAWDTRSGTRTELPGDAVVDPVPIYRDGRAEPIGAWYLGGKPRMDVFDPADEESRLLLSLQQAFPGTRVSILSATADGRLKVVLVDSDVDPGSVYLYDVVAKKADFIVARDDKIDPTRMSPMKAVELEARDGLPLHGFVTLPKGSDGKRVPMVVLPHGGPFGIFDRWGFDKEAQLLASAGYAVLQVNFRGSGNYGRPFYLAGARQWGAAMQDDLTDATRWAVEKGIADPERICIYGASYGAYAALMGAVREPGLYRCAAGYVGVYDLPKMQRDTVDDGRALATWVREWVGDDMQQLLKQSPTRRADEIRVPVFMAAGGEDFIAPIEHTERMESALRKAGVPVETLYYPKEGHGFYDVAHRREFYTRLIGFLEQHIGAGAGG